MVLPTSVITYPRSMASPPASHVWATVPDRLGSSPGAAWRPPSRHVRSTQSDGAMRTAANTLSFFGLFVSRAADSFRRRISRRFATCGPPSSSGLCPLYIRAPEPASTIPRHRTMRRTVFQWQIPSTGLGGSGDKTGWSFPKCRNKPPDDTGPSDQVVWSFHIGTPDRTMVSDRPTRSAGRLLRAGKIRRSSFTGRRSPMLVSNEPIRPTDQWARSETIGWSALKGRPDRSIVRNRPLKSDGY